MTRPELEKFDRLVKRRDWLEARIQDRARQGLMSGHDKAEMEAIDWAIDIIGAHLHECRPESQ